MEKMKYERPVMRAQAFQVNDSIAKCEWFPIGSSSFDFFQAKVGNYTFRFSKNSIPAPNDNAGGMQYYYTELESAKDSVDGLDNGRIIHDNDGAGTSTYFLEYSYRNDAFYVYQDMKWSGYDTVNHANNTPWYGTTGVPTDDTDWAPGVDDAGNPLGNGVGSLQVNGSAWVGLTNGNGAWNTRADGLGGGYYRADMSVIKGEEAIVTDGTSTEIKYGVST